MSVPPVLVPHASLLCMLCHAPCHCPHQGYVPIYCMSLNISARGTQHCPGDTNKKAAGCICSHPCICQHVTQLNKMCIVPWIQLWPPKRAALYTHFFWCLKGCDTQHNTIWGQSQYSWALWFQTLLISGWCSQASVSCQSFQKVISLWSHWYKWVDPPMSTQWFVPITPFEGPHIVSYLPKIWCLSPSTPSLHLRLLGMFSSDGWEGWSVTSYSWCKTTSCG
jgi:hypothetical protein